MIALGFVALYLVISGNGRKAWSILTNNNPNPPAPAAPTFGTPQPNQSGPGGTSAGYLPPSEEPPPGGAAPGDSLPVDTAPTISAAQIDSILRQAGSPAAGLGQTIYDLGVRYGINPAFALAVFSHETSLGTNYGNLNAGTRQWGNIRCTASWTASGGQCSAGGFRSYPSYTAAVEDFYRLIADTYVRGWGLRTVGAILGTYAPPSENDTAGYIAQVTRLIRSWGGSH